MAASTRATTTSVLSYIQVDKFLKILKISFTIYIHPIQQLQNNKKNPSGTITTTTTINATLKLTFIT